MTADYAARVRTLAARHNREWQLLVEEMDREQTRANRCTNYDACCWSHHLITCPKHNVDQRRHAEAEEHA